MIKAILLAALCCVIASGGHAESSVSSLYPACKRHAASCSDYLDGVVSGMLSHSVITRTPLGFCRTQQITPDEASELFVRGVDENAKLKAAPSAGLAFAIILQHAFPCGGKS